MAGYHQGLDEPWDSKVPSSWGLAGSVMVHALIVAAVLITFHARPSKPRVVVPVETVVLVSRQPGPQGGGGRPAPVTRPEPAPTKPAPAPIPPKPRARLKPQPRSQPVPPPPQPTKAPVIPAPPARATKAAPAPASPLTDRTRSAQPRGGSGPGQGGRGGGRGTGTGGGAGPGAGRGTGGGSALPGYLREIRRVLEKHKDYPWMARQRNIQGVVVVVFTITAGGRIESYRVSRSSGQALLDEASRETIRRVGTFPPFPAALNRRKLTVEIPLAFRLRQD